MDDLTVSDRLAEPEHYDLFDLPLVDRLVGGPRFVVRTWLCDRIEAALAEDGCRVVLVTGSPGAGKSTFMAWLAQQHPTWPRYFIRRAGEADSDRHEHEGGLASFLAVVGLQLAATWRHVMPSPKVMLDVYQDIGELVGSTTTGVSIREVVINPFQSLARELVVHVEQKVRHVAGDLVGIRIDRLILDAHQHPAALAIPALIGPAKLLGQLYPDQRVVVLIDGLDELRFRDAPSDIGRWLADLQQPPFNVRFVVFSQPTEERLTDLRQTHGDALRQVDIDDQTDAVAADIKQYATLIAADERIARVLAAHGINAERFITEATAKAVGNFQYLTFLARTLEASADDLDDGAKPVQADLNWLRNLPELPDGLPRLYEHFLTRVRRDAGTLWEAAHRAVLGLLAVARAPLTRRQLETIGGVPAGRQGSERALVGLRPFLDRDAVGAYQLYHSSVADFVVAPPGAHPALHCSPADWHARLTERACQAHGQDGSWKAADPYLRRHIAWHAAQVGLLDPLLFNPPFLVAAEPGGVLEVLGHADAARAVARLYRQVVSMLRAGEELAALAHLDLYARQEGLLQFAASVVAATPGHTWSTAWTHWQRGTVRQILGQHGGEVLTLVAADVNGRPVAVSGGNDGRLVFWDLLAGAQIGEVVHGYGGDRHSTGVTALATGELPNGDPILVSGGRDGMAQVWDLKTRRPLGAALTGIENAGSILAVGTVTGYPHVVCTAGSSARVWNLLMGSPVGPTVGAVAEAAAVASCGGRTLFAVGNKVFEAETGAPVGSPLPYSGTTVIGVALGEVDGTPLAAISDFDGNVGVWNLATGTLWAKPLEQALRRSYALAIGRLAGRAVLAIGVSGPNTGDCHIRLWDLANHSWIGEHIPIPQSGELFAMAFAESSDGFNLVTSGTEYRRFSEESGQEEDHNFPRAALRMWRLTVTGNPTSLKLVDGMVPADRNIKSVAVAGVGGSSAIFGAGDQVTWWDPSTRTERGTTYFPRKRWLAYQLPVDAIAVGEVGGKTVAVCAVGGTVRRWDVEAGAAWGDPLTGDPRDADDSRDIAGLVITALNHRPIVACASHRNAIRLWDLGTAAPAGAGTIELKAYLDAIAATELDGRTVLVIGGRDGVELRDIETGAPSPRVHPSHWGDLALAVTEFRGRPFIVSAVPALGTIKVWDTGTPDEPARPRYVLVDDDPSLIKVQAHIAAVAAVELDGELVAVHSGHKGVVQITDLTGGVVQSSLASPIKSVVVATVAGRSVVVCGGEDGIQVLDLVTGGEVFPPPTIDMGPEGTLRQPRRPKVTAVAVGELHGRAVGVYSGPVSVGAWYLDTGEPAGTPAPPAPDDEVLAKIAIGTCKGRPVVIGWAQRGQTIYVTDLDTGEPAVEPMAEMREIIAMGTVTVDGDDLFVYARSGTVRSRFLTRTGSAEEQWRRSQDMLERGETPPEEVRVGVRLTGGGLQRIAMALGDVAGVPVVVAGHEEGDVYVYTVIDALPAGAGPCRHPGAVSAVAFGRLGGRPIMVSGGQDGTVCVWDPATGARLTTIRTLAWVNSLAFAPPDRLVVGTEQGVLTIQLNPDLIPPAGLGGPELVPLNVRGALACSRHSSHVQVGVVEGEPAIRFCTKGIQLGAAQYEPLSFGLGHCYVFPGRIVITERDRADGNADGLELFLRCAYIEAQDVPHAYQHDGGHYRLAFHQPRHHRDICCYTRADRDQLVAAIEAARGARPKRPFDDIV